MILQKRLAALAGAAALVVSIGAAAQAPAACAVRDADLQGTYVGDCIGGYASGRGRAVGKDSYEGSFRDGHITGYGIYTKADGRRYEGEFLDGKMSGRVKIYNPNGDILEGQFSDNKLVGIGKLTRKTGDVIDVELKDGKLSRVSSTSGTTPSAAAPPDAAVGALRWAPRLDLDDLFPSFILATATRKEPAANPSSAAPRGDPLSVLAGLLQAAAGDQPAQGGASSVRYLGDRWGLVGVQVRTTEPNQEVVVAVEVDEIAEPTAVRFKLDAPGDYLLYPKLRYKYDRLRAITQPVPVNVNWKLTVNDKPAGSQMRTATLRSVYDAPIQARTARGPENLSWVFAAYVTEDAPWIDKILQDALQRRFVRQFVGYQGTTRDVEQQVEAVYNALKQRGIRYSSITASSNVSQKVFSQVVRFPRDSIANAQANCIDGTVLMASIFRKIGLDAFIILGPGHAMVGYSPNGDPRQVNVIETTMLGDYRFAEALRQGNARFADWMTNHRQAPQFKIIRVADARQQGVMPIAR